MNLVKAMLVREIQLIRSYFFNYVSSIVTIAIMFSILLFGSRLVISGPAVMDRTAEALVVGFFLWSWLLGGMNTLTWGITMEAQEGTLEQLYMSPYGFPVVSMVMLGVSFLSNLVFTVPLLLVIMLISGKFLHLDVLTVGLLLFLTVLPAYGLGYVFGGLALLYKRIQNLFGVLNMGIALLFLLPDRFPFYLIPFTNGYHLLSRAMRHGEGIFHLPAGRLLILILTSLLTLAVGMWIYGLVEKRVKELGILGHY